MEICECHLSFLSIKEENKKATQSRYIVPLFQKTLKAWCNRAHLYLEDKDRLSISRYNSAIFM